MSSSILLVCDFCSPAQIADLIGTPPQASRVNDFRN